MTLYGNVNNSIAAKNIEVKGSIGPTSLTTEGSNHKITQTSMNSHTIVPSGGYKTFDDQFAANITPVEDQLRSEIQNVVTSVNQVSTDVQNLSSNLTTNYLSQASLTDPTTGNAILSNIQSTHGTFVTENQAGQWYGMQLKTDVNGKEYISGFDMGAITDPNSSTSDSYFRVQADRFLVTSDVGSGGSVDDLPVFTISNGTVYFNGTVNFANLVDGSGVTVIDGGYLRTQYIQAGSIDVDKLAMNKGWAGVVYDQGAVEGNEEATYSMKIDFSSGQIVIR
jgi:hypothetical protein